jgi:hypothetical protein
MSSFKVIVHHSDQHAWSFRSSSNTLIGDEVNKDGIAELAEALEYMPLALVQVAA